MNEINLEQLMLDVRRLQDVNAIQNMVSTTSYMFAIGEYSTIYGFFSQREDVTAEIGPSGKQYGHAAVKALLVDTWQEYEKAHAAALHNKYPHDPVGEGRNGLLDLRALASPIIEVAADRKTAKGLWLIPGTQTFAATEGNDPVAHWVWTKLALDLVFEDGRWRIWHLWSVYCFAADCGKSWVESDSNAVTLSNPYSIHESYPHPPAPPKPYASFADTFSY